ncbi:UDP-N-acetylmuramate dehydrogenase [Amphritea sp. 2_MG-2023]|uniref:UDP-N-acetylmuramate dehydrogenase n=1 Tax=Amphritea TaxID=515417 RepID=UPI001C0797FE|nr:MULTISPECIES: UDP-N-acetylmuramate dehydrogenase [Amphritea]MBU2966559.1 UDP-N-acetylmuramate dehydrogenase [Amphritea atlantica]MDO6417582.1 UDP-N-acetylmuramate dehydrogenase [Amphritea sp. 2_MG-2023]
MTIEFQENISLKPYNSFGFDVSARYFAVLDNAGQLPAIRDFSQQNRVSVLFIGGGSNLVLTADLDQLVVVNQIQGLQMQDNPDGSVSVTAGAGEEWHPFVRWTLQQGAYGLENLSLIPGTVGAAPIQNIGAYGVEIKDRLSFLDAFDLETGESVVFTADECQFGYRDSLFKSRFPGRYLITAVTFTLSREFKPVLHYGGIDEQLRQRNIDFPEPLQLSDLISDIRNTKLPQPAQIGNAGSFFKNPVIPVDQAEKLKHEYPNLVLFADKSGYCKLAAGWLIDQQGWKGHRQGDAGVYAKQALVLVNYGAASGVDILEIAGAIQADVYQQFGVMLEIEPRCYP